MKYKARVHAIKSKFKALEHDARMRSPSDIDEARKLKKPLARRLEETGDALLDCYLDRYEADGIIPGDDLSYLDKRIEVIFGNGHGDYTGALDLDTIQEIKEAEQRVLDNMKIRAKEMELGVPPKHSTYHVNIGTLHGGAQVGPNNVQHIDIQTWNNRSHIRWSQLSPKVGIQRVSLVGDIEVTEENIESANEVGGDPWVELHDTTTFGSAVRQYALGLFIPA